MEGLPRLDKKAFSVSSLDNIEEEKQFWLSKRAIECIEAIEMNRRLVYGQNRVTSRLQRFLKLLNFHGVEYLFINLGNEYGEKF